MKYRALLSDDYTNAFFGGPKKRGLKTPKARDFNDTLRLLIEMTYGRLSGLMVQLFGMRATNIKSDEAEKKHLCLFLKRVV
jgi:hypothetical protein